MADPIPNTAFENSFHALRRYKMPSFLGTHRSGLTRAEHSRLSAAYPAFFMRQQARLAAYAEAEKASDFFRQQAAALIPQLGYWANTNTDDAAIRAVNARITTASTRYVLMLETQYLARIAALGIDPIEAPPEGTPAAMWCDTEAAEMPETEEAAA